MGTRTAIEWADGTWNPWSGCRKVSPGCKNCYMYRDMNRYGKDPMIVKRASYSTFFAPQKWDKYWENPRPVKYPPPPPGSDIFACSWSDWFIRDADEWREEAWAVARNTSYRYLILTKRPELIRERLPRDWGNGYPNVILGVSVENQDYLWRAETLADIPAAKCFISYEPALGFLELSPTVLKSIHWVISGGESMGRKSNEDWFRFMRDQCTTAGIAYFHKQHGGSKKIDGSWGGRLLDGEEWNQKP